MRKQVVLCSTSGRGISSFRGLSSSATTSSVLMNAVFLVASCDHEFTDRQLDHRNLSACSVDQQTPALNLSVHFIKQPRGSLGIRVQSSSDTASVPCLCMPCSVGILPPTAGSWSISLAHINPPTLCMVRISSPPTYAHPGIHRLACLSRPELGTAIGRL